MEYCIEARALKPSLRREIDVRPNQSQAVAAVDEFVYETEVHGGGFVEDFLIDDLLDFPEKEVEDGDEEEEEEKDSLSDCSAELETDENGYSTVTGDFLSLPDDASGLAVPQDDLADLEWVSRFVDDTMPELPPLYPTKSGVSGRKPSVSSSLPVQLNQDIHIKPLIIPAKPRTKRQRIGRVWSLNSSTASESSTTTSSSPSSIISSPVQFGFSGPLAKKQKTKPDPAQPADPTGRRCSHCQVQKTPQWRAGPEGAKTLCNACGVRFKSGRLYPEYRPACSPTFRGDVHSNSHRKVLEMRKKKEAGAAGSGLAVQSY
uniref:GATA transcription factor n=1 Tax=Kalanchoe fedtschenkoi TaxID=63787 RepID=A0A7N0TWL2_KALFE